MNPRDERLSDLMRDLRTEMVPVTDPTPVQWIDWPEFWAKTRNEADWIVADVLARGRGHAMWATGGNGKSEFMQWVSLEALKARHVVIYLDYEMMDDDLFDRFTDFGYGPSSDLSRLHYVLIPTLPPLDKEKGALALGALIDRVKAQHPGLHVVVIIDTIGRAVTGPENDNDTILAFYRLTGFELKQREVTWVRLDHTGHAGERARGGSAKSDDVDVVWQHTRTDTGCRLVNKKRRASWIPEDVDFTRTTEPIVTYTRTVYAWPAGTRDVATALDALGVPVDASRRDAGTALRDAGNGRRNELVSAAQKYRKGSGTTPGTTTSADPGDHSGVYFAKPHSNGAGPPPGPLGTTTPGSVGTMSPPLRGTMAPAQSFDNGNRLIDGHRVDPDGNTLRGAS